MDQLILIISSAIFGLLVVFNLVLGFLLFKFRKKLNLLLEGKKVKNLDDVILSQLQKTKKQEADITELSSKIKKLEDISEKTFQKIGMVRFNPFTNMGGNQSFVIALLDNQNNGFVISSLFIKEGNRVYSKAIKSGKSDYPLSDEECEAVDRAMNSKP
ncbi:MAG: DUF4446 family protein [Candidatus Staskawiczbacteria bacterium]|jgi:hypothetical protein